MKYAHLKTRCGCSKIIEVDSFYPIIEVQLFVSVKAYWILVSEDNITDTETPTRIFELHGQHGVNQAEYLEKEISRSKVNA